MIAHFNFHVQEIGHFSGWYLPLILAYVLGAIPFGLIIAKVFLGIDVRSSGSGNIGMTNVMRTAGKAPGIATFILDFGKGSFAVWAVQGIFGGPEVLELLAGFLVVFGHTKSVFLKFTGGKGVATNFGVWLILDWRVFLALAGIWVGLFLWKKISSLSALVGLAMLPGLITLFQGMDDQVYLGSVLAIYIIILHRSNIYRLLAGEEGKLKANKDD